MSKSTKRDRRSLKGVSPASTATPVVRRTTNMAAMDPFASSVRADQIKQNQLLVNNQQLYHAVPAMVFNTDLLSNLGIGTTGSTRTGNSVFIKDIELRLILNNKAARPNVTYRLMCTAAPVGNYADDFLELFTPGTIVASHLPHNSKLLFDLVVNPSSYGSYDTPFYEKSQTFVRVVRVNRTVQFSDINTDTPMVKLHLWCVAYDAYGTVTTDNIASIPIGTCTILFNNL